MKLPGRVSFLVAVITLAQTGSFACGPSFPFTYVARGQENRLFCMPPAYQWVELNRMLGPMPDVAKPLSMQPDEPAAPESATPPEPAASKWSNTLSADAQGLKEALQGQGMAVVDIAAAVKSYEMLRHAMKQQGDGHEEDTAFFMTNPSGEFETPREPPAVFDFSAYEGLLKSLPEEFQLYLRGAAAYRAWRWTEGVSAWDALLALPPEQRKFRTVWAAFMRGKAMLHYDAAGAVNAFEQTRALAQEGFADPLNLAADSIGWQARAVKESGDYVAAIHRYYDIFQKADKAERDAAYVSLVIVSRYAVSDPRTAEDDISRRLVLTFVLDAFGISEPCRQWLKHLNTLNPDVEPVMAGEAAWAFYRAGDMAAAKAWSEKAFDTPYGRWVKSKLLLREGKTDEALAILHELKDRFPAGDAFPDWESEWESSGPVRCIEGERGVLLLARKEYINAADAFARAGNQEDLAYIAEQVLTNQELQDYIDAHKADSVLMEPFEQFSNCKSPLDLLTRIAAKQLARQQQWEAAAKAFGDTTIKQDTPEEGTVIPRDICAAIADGLKKGRDDKLPARQRAEALYAAAEQVRTYGMEIMGTQLEPDWSIYQGGYELAGASAYRLSGSIERYTPLDDGLPAESLTALLASEDEKARAIKQRAAPFERFHYRYLAADLMWECAQLLPDNDILTAKALYYGGTWLAKRDPKAADRFYKALVRRNKQLEIGKQAELKKWFPDSFVE